MLRRKTATGKKLAARARPRPSTFAHPSPRDILSAVWTARGRACHAERFAARVSRCASACCPAQPSTNEPTTIAVLPFENLSGNPDLNCLGCGFAETIATRLSNVSSVRLVERSQLATALREFKLQDTAIMDPQTAGKLGKTVGARYVIIGSYQKFGDSFKADARLVEVETSIASGGVDVTGDYSKMFFLQTELASKLAATFASAPPKPPVIMSYTPYDWLIRGKYKSCHTSASYYLDSRSR